MSIFMTEQWTCPHCGFPENFIPECANCNFKNKDAVPEKGQEI